MRSGPSASSAPSGQPGACSSEPDGPVKAADKPKDPEPIKKIELLEEPKEDVFKTTKATADYPELKVTILKQGEGDESLTFGKIGAKFITEAVNWR